MTKSFTVGNDAVLGLPSRKRKRAPNPHASTLRGEKKHRAKKGNVAVYEDLDSVNSINQAFGRMDGQLLADYLAQKVRHFEQGLSLLEMEEKQISGRWRTYLHPIVI